MNKAYTAILAAAFIVGAGVAGYVLMRAVENRAEPWQAAEVEAQGGHEGAALGRLARDLGSEDDNTRKAAQELLARLPYQKRAWLREQAQAASDRVIRTALEKRLEEIEEMLATIPPPISLHVRNASMAEVVEALNEEMGTQLKYEPKGVVPEGTYTLDVTEQPFWEVIKALDRQRPFRFSESYGVLLVTDGREVNVEPGMTHNMVVGPFFMCAVPRYVPPGPTVGRGTMMQPERFHMQCMVFVDPRVNVVDFAFAREDVTVGPDTKGNAFKMNGGSGYAMRNAAVSGRIVRYDFEAAPGTVVSYVKAEAEFTTAATGMTLEVPELEKQGKWSQELGSAKVSGADFVPARLSTFGFQIDPLEVAPRMTFYLWNSSGMPVWSLNGALANQGMVTGRIMVPDPPYTLRVAVAKKVFKRKVSFEVREIPLQRA
jgi:hypothetical protein